MIGRATRRCDDIGKTVFRIYDPVDIYATLAEVNTMKPLVKDPNITLEQFVDELTDPEQLERALKAPGEQAGESHADAVLSQLSQKIMRVLRKAQKKAEAKPTLKNKLNDLHLLWGVEPKNLHNLLHHLGPANAAEFLRRHLGLLNQMAEVEQLLGSDYQPVISEHEDQLIYRGQSYGQHQRPEDYLDSFNRFIKDQLNQSAALAVVVSKPRDLTREQLKEIRLLLDNAGYSEAKLQTAVRNQTNLDIAANIIGHIRRAALGEPLVPFEQRVTQAKAIPGHPPSAGGWNAWQNNWCTRWSSTASMPTIALRTTSNVYRFFGFLYVYAPSCRFLSTSSTQKLVMSMSST